MPTEKFIQPVTEPDPSKQNETMTRAKKSAFVAIPTVALMAGMAALRGEDKTLDQQEEEASGNCGAEGQEESVKWKYSNGTLTISGNGAMKNYAFENLPPWYKYRDEIKTITIENGVTNIGELAFCNCYNLVEINIPSTVISIYRYAFYFCMSLKEISIPSSVISILEAAFSNCSRLTTVNYEGSNSINENTAFENCNVQTVNVPADYNGKTFCGLPVTKQQPTLPTENNNDDSQNSEEHEPEPEPAQQEEVSGNCVTLEQEESVKWKYSNGTLTISGNGEMADYGYDMPTPWENYKSKIITINIEENVTNIGAQAFWDCNKVTSISIPSSVISIKGGAFGMCSNLTTVNYEGLTDIDPQNKNNIFEDCNVQTVNVPVNYTGKTFCGLPVTKNGKLGELTWQYTEENKTLTISGNDITSQNLSKNNLNSLGIGQISNVIIGPGVTSIGKSAFEDFKDLVSITIPDSVNKIEDNVFALCSKLEKITVADDNKYYESRDGVLFSKDLQDLVCCPPAKEGTDEDSSYVIPSNVKTIKNSAFLNCKKLKSITIQDGAQTIGAHAFNGCKNLTSITIPDSVNEIGNSAFANCETLESIKIPNNVKKIKALTFLYCKNLQSVIIPSNVDEIENSAFSLCNKLGTVNYSGTNDIKQQGNAIFPKNVAVVVNVPSNYKGDKFCGLNVTKSES